MSRRGTNPRYANGNARRKLRARLRAMYERCPECGALLDWDHPYLPNSAELDEIVPVSRLPEELRRRACLDPDNVQVLCRRCNKAKGNRLPGELEMGTAGPETVVTSQRW